MIDLERSQIVNIKFVMINNYVNIIGITRTTPDINCYAANKNLGYLMRIEITSKVGKNPDEYFREFYLVWNKLPPCFLKNLQKSWTQEMIQTFAVVFGLLQGRPPFSCLQSFEVSFEYRSSAVLAS